MNALQENSRDEYAKKLVEEYKDNPDLKTFHILHLYGTKETGYPDFPECGVAKVVVFNAEDMERRTYEDVMVIDFGTSQPIATGIYVDGSTIVAFYGATRIVEIREQVMILDRA